VYLWDAPDTAATAMGVTIPVRGLEGHTDMVTSVTFSPDGKYIVSGSNDKTIRVWDMESLVNSPNVFQLSAEHSGRDLLNVGFFFLNIQFCLLISA
jgi:WD40 repeat protein